MSFGATIATLTAVPSIGYTAQHPGRKSNDSYNDTNNFRPATVAFMSSFDDAHYRAPRSPEEKFTKIFRDGIGVCFNRLVECDVVNGQIVMLSCDLARKVEPRCRVGVFLVVAGVQRAGRRVSGIESVYICPVVGCVTTHFVSFLVCA